MVFSFELHTLLLFLMLMRIVIILKSIFCLDSYCILFHLTDEELE